MEVLHGQNAIRSKVKRIDNVMVIHVDNVRKNIMMNLTVRKKHLQNLWKE